MADTSVDDAKNAFDSSLAVSRLLINTYGFWPYDIMPYKQANTLKERFFAIFRPFVLFLNVMFVTSEILYLLLVTRGRVIPTIECIITMVTMCFYTLISFILYYQRDKIIYIIDTLRSYTEIRDKHNFAMFVRNSLRLKVLSYVLYIITGICVFVYIGVPLALAYRERQNNKNEDIDRPLPFNAWYPYDVNDNPYYQISFALELFRGIGILHTITGYDSLFALVIVYTSGQYLVLKTNFENIFAQARETLKHRGYVHEQSELNVTEPNTYSYATLLDKEVNILLKNNIRHHIALNDLCNKEEHIYSPTIFMHLVLHAGMLCLVVYLSLMSFDNGDYGNCVKYSSFIILLIIELFMYGYIGTMLIEASTSLTEGCFHSEWYETSSKSFKSSLHIVMHRSQTPCMLTGLKFTVLSLEIVLAILSSSYSYFTLLNTVN